MFRPVRNGWIDPFSSWRHPSLVPAARGQPHLEAPLRAASATVPSPAAEIPRHPVQIRAVQTRIAFPAVFALVSALASAQSLTIRLYDYSGLTPHALETLTDTTTLIFERAGIQVDWLHCSGVPENAPACADRIAAGEIIVRLNPGRPSRSSHGALGTAIVGPQGGHVAIVFAPTVRRAAAELEIPYEVLLGFAVAHEAGHCLLGPGHSAVGLMRCAWSDRDARQMLRFTLGFSRLEAVRAAARLTFPPGAVRIPRPQTFSLLSNRIDP